MAIEVVFLGVSTASPGAGEESTCFAVNGNILVDAGWNAAINMKSCGVEPTDIDHVFFTHCHQDHTIGLPGLLFANRHRDRARTDPPQLTLYGPRDLAAVCDGALTFLQADRDPHCIPDYSVQALFPGDSREVGDLRIDVGRSFHPLDARCYRITDTVSGACTVLSGDTAYHDGLSVFASGCDVLIHEAALDAAAEDASIQQYLHSRPQDAARVAKEAGASSLALVHYKADSRRELLNSAKEIFPNTRLAKKGQRLQVLGPGQAAWI